jgi:hypothetical protein
MAAVIGIENALYFARRSGVKYWKIYSANNNQGATIDQCSKDADISLDQSLDELRTALHKLTPSTYKINIFRTFTSDENKDNATKVVASFIVDINYGQPQHQQPVAGIGGFSLEGIGLVTPENFEEALTKKMTSFHEKQKAADELTSLKAQLAEYKKNERETEYGFKKGILSIGTVLHPIVSKLPAYKEVMQTISGVMGAANNEALPVTPLPSSALYANDISGTEESNQDQLSIEDSMRIIAHGNPNVAKELAALAKLKQQNPSMYTEGVEMVTNMITDEIPTTNENE